VLREIAHLWPLKHCINIGRLRNNLPNTQRVGLTESPDWAVFSAISFDIRSTSAWSVGRSR
jgi:hypothetical protein